MVGDAWEGWGTLATGGGRLGNSVVIVVDGVVNTAIYIRVVWGPCILRYMEPMNAWQ